MPDPAPSLHLRWLALIGVILAFWALKATYAVFAPLTAAVFLVVLVYPVYRWLARKTHGAVAFIATFLLVLAGFAAFFALVGWALTTIVSKLPAYEAQFVEVYDRLQAMLDGFGVALSEPREVLRNGTGSSLLSNAAQTVGLKVQAFLTYFFLTLGFVALGLGDVRGYGWKLDRIGGVAGELRAAAREFGPAFRGYLGAVTLTAFITAVLCIALGLAVGLEFALVFGLLSFLMNYIPAVGSVIAIFPPTLFALVQYDGLAMPLVVFLGFSAIELTVGNYVTPKVEARVLSLTPTVILLAIVFWGWLWGALGALLAVPFLIALAFVCKRFEHTRWIAVLVQEPRASKA